MLNNLLRQRRAERTGWKGYSRSNRIPAVCSQSFVSIFRLRDWYSVTYSDVHVVVRFVACRSWIRAWSPPLTATISVCSSRTPKGEISKRATPPHLANSCPKHLWLANSTRSAPACFATSPRRAPSGRAAVTAAVFYFRGVCRTSPSNTRKRAALRAAFC